MAPNYSIGTTWLSDYTINFHYPTVATSVTDWSKVFERKRDDDWLIRERWLAGYRPWPEIQAPRLQAVARTMRRAPARQCVRDARRWKRRRLVQKLRGEA